MMLLIVVVLCHIYVFERSQCVVYILQTKRKKTEMFNVIYLLVAPQMLCNKRKKMFVQKMICTQICIAICDGES